PLPPVGSRSHAPIINRGTISQGHRHRCRPNLAPCRGKNTTGAVSPQPDAQGGSSLSPACTGFTEAGSDEPGDAGGSEPEHLEAGPHRQKHEQVEPARRTLIDKPDEPHGGGEVWDRQQHRYRSPLHAETGTDGDNEDVGGHVAAQEVSV